MASLPLLTARPPFPRPRVAKPRTAGAKKKALVVGSTKKLEPLYDDGYLKPKGVRDHVDAMSELVRFDKGPPRWFCPVECGPPVDGAPLLLFLPGIDGNGMGLFMHHKALGRIFELRCMHVPFCDRSPFEGLIKFVEDAVRLEHSASKHRPIYLLGHSFGGCLALSIAARNPNIDLLLILTNPATSFGKSQWQPFIPVLQHAFVEINAAMLFFLNLYIDNQAKWGTTGTSKLNPIESLDELSKNLISPLLLVSISKETILWKLEVLRLASAHANSRLHAIKAEVLVLASCLDNLLPSKDEGQKLAKSLLNCKVYYFENFGHNILMENGIHLCSIVKSSGLYRLGRVHDYVEDFLPSTMTELQLVDEELKLLYLASCPAIFSTLEDGRIVRGLSGIPNDGPVLLVGNHMLLGLDTLPLAAEFLREKRICLRGVGHPILFMQKRERAFKGHEFFDFTRLFGSVPVSNRNLYKLLSEKSFVLLYPGGAREALHGKGEEYKLFWPTQPEFVRMAAKFGAKIIPFASVGEDDIIELLLDYNDLMKIPFTRDEIIETNHHIQFMSDASGVRDQDLFLPVVRPKVPGRYYYLFGKPIDMSGKIEVLKEKANELYSHIKYEIERIISYLLKRREEDQYRSIFQRSLCQATSKSCHQVPSFEP